jgi:hypothetical protein
LKTPKIKPKDLSIEPIPVQVTALLKDLPTSIRINKDKIKIKIPKPMLFKNSDSIYSETHGRSFGTKIIVIITDKTHFIKDIKLNENPLAKH